MRPLGARPVLVLCALLLCACQASHSPTAPVGTLESVPVVGVACGVERWSVKTLSDAEAWRVEPGNVVFTSIAALNAGPARCLSTPDRRSYPEEFQAFEVVGRVTRVRTEDDRDLHVVVADEAGNTVIAEVADPACSGAVSSPHLAALQAARRTFLALGVAEGRRVRVRGVGFYDPPHGQSGMARSCMELHPVLAITAE